MKGRKKLEPIYLSIGTDIDIDNAKKQVKNHNSRILVFPFSNIGLSVDVPNL